jgi:asparaginyl-tRNA synthetase
MDTQRTYEWTSDVLRAMRLSLAANSFDELLPELLASRSEPGARHAIAVLGDSALPRLVNSSAGEAVTVSGKRAYYLPVSHAVEKQLAMEYLDRAYVLAPCVRLVMPGEEESGRHLFTFFQVEVEWKTCDGIDDLGIAEKIIADFALNLAGTLKFRQGISPLVSRNIASLLCQPYPRITFDQALSRVRGNSKRRSVTNPHSSLDLSWSEEESLCSTFTTPIWLHKYPEGVRDSLYRRGVDGTYNTYDLLLPFGYGEVATGGQRPESGAEIILQSNALGKEYNPDYVAWKDSSGTQSAGIGFGLERLTRFCSASSSILELRRHHGSGPNTLL